MVRKSGIRGKLFTLFFNQNVRFVFSTNNRVQIASWEDTDVLNITFKTVYVLFRQRRLGETKSYYYNFYLYFFYYFFFFYGTEYKNTPVKFEQSYIYTFSFHS